MKFFLSFSSAFRLFAFLGAALLLQSPPARAAGAKPQIYAFNVSGATTMNLGETKTFNWSVGNAATVTLTPGVGVVTGDEATVTPTTTTTYVLTATNANGSVTASKKITVIVPPVFQSIAATPDPINAGASATLSWSAPGTSYFAVATDGGADLGNVFGNSLVVKPSVTTTYTVAAHNTAGTDVRTVKVTVNAPLPKPAIAAFTATPSSIVAGNAATLSWSVANATSLAISPGVGGVTGSSVSVTPTASTIYTLTATNASGSASRKVSVTIASPAPAPVIASFTATPASVTPGQPVTLKWAVAGADSLSLSPGIGAVTGTSFTFTPQVSGTYVLVATSAGGAVAKSVDLTVVTPVAPPTILSFTSTPGTVAHPRIWVTSSRATTLNVRAAANDAAWLKLRADADALVSMPIQFPDEDQRSNTINGGYQYNDYLLPSETLALAYVATKVADSVRAAGYAAKERKLLLVLADPVRHGRPTTDSGYSIRSYVPALALGYDWIYETLSDADRAQIYTEINRWVASFDAWVEFLFHNPNAPTAEYRTQLSYRTSGDGQVAMRSAWTPNAVWATFQSGPLTNFPDSAEELFDQGSLAIQRGNVQFLVNPWGALMRNTPGTDDGNGVFDFVYNELFATQTDGVASGRRIFNLFYAARQNSYWGQVGNGPGDAHTTLARFEDGGSFVFMRGTRLEDQYADDHPIASWTRNLAYVRPQLFVVYDRTTLKSASVDNWLAWHVAGAPADQSGATPGTHRFDVVDARAAFGGNLFRGRVSTVLPASNQTKIVDLDNRHKVYRIEVRPLSPIATSAWLTVFDAAASATAAKNAAPLSASAGGMIVADGTLISGGDGSSVAVLFSKSGAAINGALSFTLPAADTYCLVTDLAPGAGYAINVDNSAGQLVVTLAPGGAFTTSAQGSLAFNVSAAGAVSQPDPLGPCS